MGKVYLFETSIEIAAPAEHIWSIMSDVERWSEWTPSVKRINLLGGKPLAIGSRAWVFQPKLPPALWRVIELEERRGFTWVASGPGFRAYGRHYIEVTPGGSKVTLSVQYDGPLASFFSRFTSDINNRYIAMEAAGLKRRSEELSHM